MEPIDVDEIIDVDFPGASANEEGQCVEVTFKDGTMKTFTGPDLAEALPILNHWTPPTA